MREIEIGGRTVGPGHPCFIVAEVGVNHNGKVNVAKQLVDAAAKAGAEAVKFQTFRAERLTVEREARDLLRPLELSREAFREVTAYCKERGLIFLSTPFDEESADFLVDLGIPAFKIGSGDLTHLPLLAHVARHGKPVLLSTGMSFLEEVADSVKTLREGGTDKIVLLHCVSRYPAHPAEANLRSMKSLADRFDLPVGFSDHTLGIEVALAAVALGASVVEKHITLDRSLPGPDHAASLEPSELQELVRSVRLVESALGDGVKKPSSGEEEMRKTARRSIVARVDIPSGSRLERSLLAFKRPGTGIPSSEVGKLEGRRARAHIPKDTLISWEMVE